MKATARLRYMKGSAQKVRLVADLVRGWRASILTATEDPSPATGRRAAFGRLAAVVDLSRDHGHAD